MVGKSLYIKNLTWLIIFHVKRDPFPLLGVFGAKRGLLLKNFTWACNFKYCKYEPCFALDDGGGLCVKFSKYRFCFAPTFLRKIKRIRHFFRTPLSFPYPINYTGLHNIAIINKK